ncbi:MAG: undecaprenyl-diphosphate phosphatase [Fidelibacterota bacterium]|nr:MAG: undecaprenyl-diphosphate phosphatase [Candidatus Neomarinimicrobiota bacterium]
MELETLLLGIIQGATEFLPISSSAHLVIAQALLNVQFPGLLVEVALHLGTLISVLIYFRRDLIQLTGGFFRAGNDGTSSRREVGYLALATLPALVVALTLGDAVEAVFDDAGFAGWMLLVTTVVLATTRWSVSRETTRMSWAIALIIGSAQALAILPGISRSGITIAAGLWLGLSGVMAARFAFLLAIPAILGAGIFKLLDVIEGTAQSIPGLTLGFLAAALVGYIVIAWLMNILRKGQMYFFSSYTLPVGLMVIFWL